MSKGALHCLVAILLVLCLAGASVGPSNHFGSAQGRPLQFLFTSQACLFGRQAIAPSRRFAITCPGAPDVRCDI